MHRDLHSVMHTVGIYVVFYIGIYRVLYVVLYIGVYRVLYVVLYIRMYVVLYGWSSVGMYGCNVSFKSKVSL